MNGRTGNVEGDMAFLQEDPDPGGQRKQGLLCLVSLPPCRNRCGLPFLPEAARCRINWNKHDQ